MTQHTLSRRSFIATTSAVAAVSSLSPALAADPIVLAYSAWPGWFPLKVAEAKGLFAKNGVNVQLKWFDNYTDSISALSAGKVDGNCETTNDAISAQAAGGPRKIVLTTDNSAGNDQVIAKKSIPDVKGLVGKSVAVEIDVVDYFLLLLALKKAGVPDSAVHVKPLPTDQAASAFASGKVDACAVFAPFTTNATATGLGHVIASSKDFPGAIPDHLVFTPEIVAKRPGDIQKIVNTWFETLAYIKANKTESVAIMAKIAGVSPSDYVAYDAGTHIFNLAENLESFAPGTTMTHLTYSGAIIAKFLASHGLAKTVVDVNTMLDGTFVKAYAAAHSSG
ncbi:MAG TPA: aliphatic sulfonate ABC transporter substrate-binding protein [Candidatus Baltobacteraceae bacterium]